jgi:type I restriction enzyme M protein
MLDSVTKTRINTARDILVGKVPDPKSQVEQITIALIYKFMDDMDVEAEELGGKRTFFSGEYAKYSWRKIFDPRQSGHELLNLYSETITKMDTNPGVPKLFRDIFKNAYLPYRDPETLKSFLKIINEFEYTHSEKLGDAFEFLLSILGSQGDAGQFRTPRHIIDFMVAVIDPKKHEVILDPACGTAGFLISSYKHIIKQNSSNFIPDEDNHTPMEGTQSVNEVILTTNGYNGDMLTADERTKLADNMHGYDISPDMVRLSLVNMYLHGVKEPQIFEYDSLTSEDHWNEYSDVILANPPFMSPKGGIRPHKRFSVQSNRSEVLFVDYIAEHLTQDGRAAVIVPEGIIFQSGNAYKQLRKMLVEKYLVGVISLPAGVFNPYSGVKTSILWLDKSLAKKTDKILFVKIENDGFDLGAQRRAIKQNDLPVALRKISDYRNQINSGKIADFESQTGISLVKRADIGGNGDYNLSGDRYLTDVKYYGNWKIEKLGNLCFKITDGSHNPPPSTDGGKLILSSQNIFNHRLVLDNVRHLSDSAFEVENKRTDVRAGDVLLTIVGTIGRCLVVDDSMPTFVLQRSVAVFKPSEEVNSYFLSYMLLSDKIQKKLISESKGVAQKGIYLKELKTIEIPVPPLSIQKEIVEEVESYQKIIDGARQVVENYKPRIDIDPEWEMVGLGEIAEFKNGLNYKRGESGEKLKIIGVRHFQDNLYAPIHDSDDVQLDNEISQDYLLHEGDILFVRSNGNQKLVGRSILIQPIDQRITFSGFTIRCRFTAAVSPLFYAYLFKTQFFRKILMNVGRGANIRNITQEILSEIKVHKPGINTQSEIAGKLENEEKLIYSTKSLIDLYEQKIRDRISKVWGE